MKKQSNNLLPNIFLSIYKATWYFLTLIIFLIIYRRKKKGKECPDRYKEKFGISSIKIPLKKVIWFHAVSLGEVMSIEKLIHLINKNNEYTVLVTTTTISSANWAKENISNIAIHQFFPLDHPIFIKRFLNKWQPHAVFFIDSEIWPNWLYYIKKNNIFLGLINARISDKTYEFWIKKPNIYSYLLNYFDIIIPQSKLDKEKLEEFNLSCTKPLNLKRAADPLGFNKSHFYALKIQINNRPIWIAASTHYDEEIIFAKLHEKLLQDNPNILLIIIPRHNTRTSQIATDIQQKTGLKIALRSMNETISDDINIYLADTMGEMGLFYRLNCPVIIGGSFIKHGGQNPLQAAHFANLLLLGPDMNNFKEVESDFIKQKAAIKVENIDDLQNILQDYFNDTDKFADYIKNANYFIAAQKNITMDVHKIIFSKMEEHNANT